MKKVKPIQSFAKHYEEAQNLMPHSPWGEWNERRLEVPDRPWYRRIANYLLPLKSK